MFCMALAAATLAGCGGGDGPGSDPGSGDGESDPTTDRGVFIGGVRWATRNVGTARTFVDRPEDTGKYYMFQDALEICPVGWRTPTDEEFERLIASGYEWTKMNGVNGGLFGDGKDKIFLPAAGDWSPVYLYRGQGSRGKYWSSINYNPHDANAYHYLLFYDTNALVGAENFSVNHQVRCVAN